MARKKSAPIPPADPPYDAMVRRLLRLPRLLRIILIFVPTFAVTLVIAPVIDALYLRYFFTPETRILPSLVIAGVALVMYMIGWVLIVGTSGEQPEERQAAVWYTIASILTVLLAFMWLTYLFFTNLRIGDS
ncbi:MAG: hypothetical protein MUF87_06160 [Anaerolineae bacterium]|jgi:uncharacterized membrane protein YhdT|nr:hypothetical protein [Anaerolineae bacterium]